MRTLATAAFAATLLASGSVDGIRPRPSASDYPAQDSAAGVTIGAAVVPASQLKGLFSTDLSGYVVVEATVYLEAGKQVDLSSVDFALRIGSRQEIVRAANPKAIAASLQRKNAPAPSKPGDITVVPTATIGWESGGGYDPVTGQRRQGGGVYTGAGVGVGVGGGVDPGPRGPAGTDRDRQIMTQELEDKALPSGKTDRPVAGYLYFPLPNDKSAKGAAYEMQYYGLDGKLRVQFPAERKK